MGLLLKKEFSLAMHPIAPLMLILSAMVLIPNYPYTVIFFYVSMGIFFTCLLGRENNDIVYSLNLPVKKSNIVKSRYLFSVILEMIQLVIMIPLTFLSNKLVPQGNLAGMDANISLFSIGFIIYGLFNLIFLMNYYKNVKKVGVAFVKWSIVIFLIATIDAVSTNAFDFVKNYFDGTGTNNLTFKIIFLTFSIIVFVLLTMLSLKKSIAYFEKQDIN